MGIISDFTVQQIPLKNLICHMLVAAAHCCVVDISARIIDRLILNPVQEIMQCRGGL